MKRLRWPGLLLCLLATLAAAFSLPGTANAQQEPESDYVDLVMIHEYDGRDVAYSVRNVGTAMATGVAASFHIKDLQISPGSVPPEITDKRTDDATREQWFTWEVGTILAGDTSANLTFSTSLHSGHTTADRFGVITATASSNQPEPGFLLGNNEIKVYSFAESTTGATLHMDGNDLRLLLSVDDLRPDAGDDVDFDLTARNFNTSAANTHINLIADASVKVELSDGLEFKSGWTPPATFVKSGSQSATWSTPDTDVTSSNLVPDLPNLREIEIEAHLTTDSLDDIPLEERCLTAQVEDSIPPPSPGYVFGSLKQCLGDDPPLLFTEGSIGILTTFPCDGDVNHICRDQNDDNTSDSEVVVAAVVPLYDETVNLGVTREQIQSNLRSQGVGRAGEDFRGIVNSNYFLPESIVIQVKDPEGRVNDTYSHSLVSSGPSWQTGRKTTGRTGADILANLSVSGVLVTYTKKTFNDHLSDWTSMDRKLSVTYKNGDPVSGGITMRSNPTGKEFLTTDPQNTRSTTLSSASTSVVPYFFEFPTLGTYTVGIIAEVTHTDTNVYSDTGSYTFHVGPIAELEVRDAGPQPGLATTQRAFTIMAVHNGPDDAPAAQVTVTGLRASDYVSHTTTAGSFNSGTGAWTIGELINKDVSQPTRGRDGEVLTIITSAAVDTEITAAITNTQDYQVCIDSDGDDVEASNQADCKTNSGNTNVWHAAVCVKDSDQTVNTTATHDTQAECEAQMDAHTWSTDICASSAGAVLVAQTEAVCFGWHTTSYYDYNSDNSTDVTIKAKDGTGADLPSVQSAQPKTAAIVVSWDPITEVNGRKVTHYEVQRETNPWETVAENVTGITYVDTDVEAGDTHRYRVRAVNDWDHKGPWSPPIKGTVPVPETASAGRPEAPVLTASLPEGADGRTQIDLGWERPVENGAPITSYTLEVADSSNGPWAAPDPAPQLGRSDTSWSHTGLNGGTRKYYRMKATNSEGDSDWSDTIDATTRAPGKAGPPLNVQATPDGGAAIDLMWDPPIDDGGSPIRYYEVQWSADGTGGWRGAGRTTDAETRTFKHSGLRFGTTRYYRVAARNSVTLGEWSDPPVSATTLAGVPGMPNLTARAAGANTIELTWTTPADNGSAIIRYELEWSPDGTDGSWTSLTNPLETDTSYSDGGLDPGTERHYRIRAVNGATPGEGAWSTVRRAVTPPAVPGAPTLRADANGQNAIDLAWEPPSDDGGADITGYELHWSADGAENSYSRLTSPSGTARSHTHGNLQPGTTRYYQLRARNRAGLGEFSFPAFATTLTGVPAAPSLTVRANGASEIKLSWTKPDDRGSDIFGYHLQQSDDGHDWHFLGGAIPAGDTEYVHTGLDGGTTKHYRVRAQNNNGDGQWSQSRSARTDAGGPDAPVLTLTVISDNQIDLEWMEPANNGSSIRGYWVERSVDGNEPWERLTSNNRTTEYSDTTLYRGMTRHYRVAAFNGAGTGPYSETKSAMTTGDPATAPETPTLLRFSDVSRNQVTIAWDPPEEDGGAPVTGYEYQVARPCEDDPNTPENESESNCGFTGEDIRETTGTSARISGLNTDGHYDFQVRAVNIAGRGEWAQTIQATLHPSTSGQVRVSPATITVNEGSTVTYTIRLSTAPPHPVQAWIQPQGSGRYNDIEEAAYEYNLSLLVPSGWTHPDPNEVDSWSEFSYNWNQGVRVTFTAPDDGDTEDEVAVMSHFVTPLPYDQYRPCRQETQAERDQCRQDWDDAWENSPYQFLTGASVKVTVRDND